MNLKINIGYKKGSTTIIKNTIKKINMLNVLKDKFILPIFLTLTIVCCANITLSRAQKNFVYHKTELNELYDTLNSLKANTGIYGIIMPNQGKETRLVYNEGVTIDFTSAIQGKFKNFKDELLKLEILAKKIGVAYAHLKADQMRVVTVGGGVLGSDIGYIKIDSNKNIDDYGLHKYLQTEEKDWYVFVD